MLSRLNAFEAEWMARTFPCQRFILLLAEHNARPGADGVRFTFIVRDFHARLLAGLRALHFKIFPFYEPMS
jgi:hypothetical protein